MPGISDPTAKFNVMIDAGFSVYAKICVYENIPVVPFPGPSAFFTALSASGLSTDEFKFVGLRPSHADSQKERLVSSASETTTQLFYVPPQKLCQFQEIFPIFGDSRQLNSLAEGPSMKN